MRTMERHGPGLVKTSFIKTGNLFLRTIKQDGLMRGLVPVGEKILFQLQYLPLIRRSATPLILEELLKRMTEGKHGSRSILKRRRGQAGYHAD